MKKILIAMSGGVDSSAVAAMLQEQGYEAVGATMQLWHTGDYFEGDHHDPVPAAKRVAKELGIPHYVLDCSAEFRRDVVEPFMEAYQKGLTPNPCIFCNKALKFGAFFEKAMEMGFDGIATGHYAKIVTDSDGIHHLHMANSAKDQSYVLYQLNQDVLSHLLLPLYGVDKEEVRRYAAKAGISASETPDSQEICFIPNKDYPAFLSKMGVTSPEGDFVNLQGEVMGKHKGILHYTVGQRKGLGAFGSPKYVLQLNPKTNQVVLGENEDLFSSILHCKDVTFLSGKQLIAPMEAQVKIRYTARPAQAMLIPTEFGIRVEFTEPQRAATPGQSAVFYNGDELLGGGIIV
ncbi:MAG: tRNA 2-thiouridine(34) synthase MnmA [Clostridia bacterium]|nr:tRNA 2-thiouridine(34) synthase MnmA [Clostridia bacterium]